MMLLVLFETVMRYVFHQPPMVADEFSAYMLIAVAYLGMAATWKEKGHVRITTAVTMIPPKVASWVRLVTLVIGLTMAIILTASSCGYVLYSFKIHMRSSTWLNTPLQPSQLTLLIGFTVLSLLIITQLARAILKIRSGESVEEATR